MEKAEKYGFHLLVVYKELEKVKLTGIWNLGKESPEAGEKD